MQAQLTFNLPDDQEEYELCNKAQDMSYALHQIQQYLRSKVKYETHDEKKWEAYDEIYQQFYVILNEHDIKL
jgi:hypothetical protein